LKRSQEIFISTSQSEAIFIYYHWSRLLLKHVPYERDKIWIYIYTHGLLHKEIELEIINKNKKWKS